MISKGTETFQVCIYTISANIQLAKSKSHDQDQCQETRNTLNLYWEELQSHMAQSVDTQRVEEMGTIQSTTSIQFFKVPKQPQLLSWLHIEIEPGHVKIIDIIHCKVFTEKQMC